MISQKTTAFPGLPGFLLGVSSLFLCSPPAALHAGPPKVQVWSSARDFLAGDAAGVSITAGGRLVPGPGQGVRTWPADAPDAVIFSAAADGNGRVYLATGGGTGRLFVADPSGQVRLLFEATEPNLTAVAVSTKGTVVCAASPNGPVYRVDVSSKKPAEAGQVWANPNENAIWSLAFGKDDTLFMGTGNKGRVYKRDTSGKLDLLAEIEDTHIRSLAAGKDGTVYAGTSDRGVVVAITPAGVARTLHDFGKPEVTAIAIRPDGFVYAAASALEIPSLASRAAPAGKILSPTPTPTPAPQEAPRGTVSVSTSTRLSPGGGATPSKEANSEIVLIHPNGYVEPVWGFPEEAVFGLGFDGTSSSLLVSTGQKGRLYALEDRQLRLITQTEERQVLAAFPVGAGYSIVTMSAAGVTQSGRAGATEASFICAPKDLGRMSTVSRIRSDGRIPAGTSVAFFARSGNASKPDKTWSGWVPASPAGEFAKGALPAARFFQWKAVFRPTPKETPSIERVEAVYAEVNARPVLENLTILDPNAVFPRGGAASGPAVLSITNPDEQGIFQGVEPPRDSAGDPLAKKLFRKGFRTASWKGVDPNGDSLRYDVEIQAAAGGPRFFVRRDVEDQYLSFDTAALPDGRYRLRVTASDKVNQSEGEELTDSEESGVFTVDNTPPVLKVVGAAKKGERAIFRISAADALSPLLKAEGTVNGDRWRPLPAADGVTDSETEQFVLDVPVPAGPAFLSIRVVDVFGNVSSIASEFPREFR